MRSIKAFVAAATIVLSYPLALGVEQLVVGGANTVVHLVTGAGFVLFATSVFDFDLPRWVNVIGTVAAAAFGAIFLMQGVVDLTNVEPLRTLAFDVLGQHVERLLPDVVYLWFAALLLLDSAGRSRILGWAVMVLVFAAELGTLAALLFQFSFPDLKVVVLLPFVWLLFESAERRGTPRRTTDQAPHQEPAIRRANARP
jgi:hypothetical protein